MRNAGLEEAQAGIKIAGRNISIKLIRYIICKYLLLFISSLFTLLIGSFTVENIFLMLFHLFTFAFVAFAWGDISPKMLL